MVTSSKRLLVVTAASTMAFGAAAWMQGDLGRAGSSPVDIIRDFGLVALNTLPLLAIRRNPLVVVLVDAAAYVTWIETGHLGNPIQSLPALVALYALGSWSRPLWLRAIGPLLLLMMFAGIAWWHVDPLVMGYVAIVSGVVWALGAMVAARREYVRQLEERTAQLEAARQELAERAVVDERTRIARELHDVVAHTMSVITVQAGVGAHLVDSQPGQAAEALRVIERVGRDALAEMRRIITVLRDHDPPARSSRPQPQPGLANLAQLIDQVDSAGVKASVSIEGTAFDLSPGLDLVAYRVIQEALTNVVKHAAGSAATVTIRYRNDSVTIDVQDHGGWRRDLVDPAHNPASGPAAPGLGLLGMAERVALYDGRLETSDSEDGFRVVAHFPIMVEQ